MGEEEGEEKERKRRRKRRKGVNEIRIYDSILGLIIELYFWDY